MNDFALFVTTGLTWLLTAATGLPEKVDGQRYFKTLTKSGRGWFAILLAVAGIIQSWIQFSQAGTAATESADAAKKAASESAFLREKLTSTETNLSATLGMVESLQNTLIQMSTVADKDYTALVSAVTALAPTLTEPQKRYSLGKTLELAGRPGSLDAYESAIALDPKYAEALNNAANILDGQGKTNKAGEYRARAYNARTDDAVMAGSYAQYLVDRGSFEDARVVFNQMRSHQKLEPQFCLSTAGVMVSIGSTNFFQFLEQYMEKPSVTDGFKVGQICFLGWPSMTAKQRELAESWLPKFSGTEFGVFIGRARADRNFVP